jgi:ribosomal protein L32
MPRYDVRNDGVGPYAIFYCDVCSREYRSQPDVANTVVQDIGRQTLGNALRGIPLFGRAVADSVAGQDPRYINSLTGPQLEAAWKQTQAYFRECPTCHQIVCLSDFDEKSGFCKEDSPRSAEIAEAQAEQAAGMVKGIAGVFGLGDVLKSAVEAAKQASTATARCPKDGTLAPAGTKFCPECGSPMVQPAPAPTADVCPACGAQAQGARFCPECGTKIERPAPAPTVCPACGAEAKGARFCPECGTKIA